MPVDILLCEGGENSPDIRVLHALLAGSCQVKASGSKYGMAERVLMQREVLQKTSSLCGLLDGDFLTTWLKPIGRPRSWTIQKNNQNVHIGWRWERKEIENYLIDPIIVHSVLKEGVPNPERYHSALHEACDSIAYYQAARIALSASRQRIVPLQNSFGTGRGKEKYLFPAERKDHDCMASIEKIISDYESCSIPNIHEVLQRYKQYKEECLPGGERYVDFLNAFSGKDLLWAMDPWLRDNGFRGALSFRELLVSSLTMTQNIRSLFPEWIAMYEYCST